MALFQVSPLVNWTEKDLTTVPPSVSTTPAAMAGAFQWGPVGEITLIGSPNKLVDTFGKPKSTGTGNDSTTPAYFYLAWNFLQYGASINIVRVVDSNALNAADSAAAGGGILVKNEDHYETVKTSFVDELFVAKYPGTLGNSLHVSVHDADTSSYTSWVSTINGTDYDNDTLFDSAPGTSTYASDRGGSNDEIHVVIRDKTGAWSGEIGTVLETFSHLSQASDAKNADGTNNYYVDVINEQSEYIWWATHETNLTDAGSEAAGTTFTTNGSFSSSLANGVDDNDALSSSVLQLNGYDLFANDEKVDISLVIVAPATAGDYSTIATYCANSIAEVRKDCVVFCSPELSDTTASAVKDFHDLLPNSSYLFPDDNWKYQKDAYNDKYVWVPCCGDVAGLAARTDQNFAPWYSFAGYNRGFIKNVVKLRNNFGKSDRDTLYKAGINSIIAAKGEGPVLLGDKTHLAKAGAFDRINVRRLFIVIEKTLATAAKYQLHEFNDEFTRSQVKATINPFLRTIQGDRGLEDFDVICDTTNNPEDVVKAHEFIVDVFIKPNYVINYIQLNFMAVDDNFSFNELGG